MYSQASTSSMTMTMMPSSRGFILFLSVLLLLSTTTVNALTLRKVRCTNTQELSAAIESVRPGDEIIVAPGNYYAPTVRVLSWSNLAQLTSSVAGTEANRIILRGESAADPPTISGSSPQFWSVIRLVDGADYWTIQDLILSNADKGIVIDGSNNVIIQRLQVHTLGEEGIHVRDGSKNTLIEYCTVTDTGLTMPGFGEGIYVGSDKSVHSFFKPDVENTIIRHCQIGPNVRGEPFDVREGTTNTVIEYSTVDATGLSGENFADSFVDLKGSRAYIRFNTFYRNNAWAVNKGVAILDRGIAFSGQDNVIHDNFFDFDRKSNLVMVQAQGGTSNTIVFDNASPANNAEASGSAVTDDCCPSWYPKPEREPDVVPGAAFDAALIVSPTPAPVAVTPAPVPVPTDAPVTAAPEPTDAPVVPVTAAPSVMASDSPTVMASAAPTIMASVSPTVTASATPTVMASDSPTVAASASPSITASAAPSVADSASPTITASAAPSATPSATPSAAPSPIPSTMPSNQPSAQRSVMPSPSPSERPTNVASESPSAMPSPGPTAAPVVAATAAPVSAAPVVAATAVPVSAAPVVAATAVPVATVAAPVVVAATAVPVATVAAPVAAPTTAAPVQANVADSTIVAGTDTGGTADPVVNVTIADGPFCDDSDFDTYFVNSTGEFQRCPWLASRPEYVDEVCNSSRGAEVCPETCGICTDNCEDTGEKFFAGPDHVHCIWLRLRPELKKDLCFAGSDAALRCPETCDVCDAPRDPATVDATSESIAPTPVPMPSGAICDDDKYKQFWVPQISELEGCIWLAARPEYQTELCKPDDPSGAYDICEETCKKCVDDCEDTTGKFPLGTNIRDCLWLSIRPDVQKVVCVEDDPVMAICPESCDTCDGNGTLAPTPSPGPVTTFGLCDDSKFDTFFVEDLNEFQRCVWLAARPDYREQLCPIGHDSRTAEVCPETCGVCTDDCNDLNLRFMIGRSERDCLWLSLRPTLHEELCEREDIKNACLETCNVCDALS